MKRKLTDVEIKSRLIEILDYIKLICEQEKISYSLAYGTLLGAVRHGGFIPWDDDVDVCMLRADYDKFVHLLKRQNNGRFRIMDSSNNDTYYYCFAKLVDFETEAYSFNDDICRIRDDGVNIDIFPIDNCPSEPKEFEEFHSKLRRVNRLRALSIRKKMPKGKNALSTLALCVIMFYTKLFGHKHWVKKYDKLMRTYNSINLDMGTSFPTTRSIKELIPLSQFKNMKSIEFEGKMYSCFSDVYSYLENRYGDYMKLPPENERVAPHEYIAYLK